MELLDVDVDGVGLRVATVGKGPRLLVLNGSGSTIEKVAPLLEILGANFAVACHDQRGLGASAAPAGSWSMAEYAIDALGVARHLGWETFNVLGISFGGMVALEMAALAPDRLIRLALWCTSPGGHAPSFPLHELGNLPAPERIAATLAVTDTRFNPWWFLGHPKDRALARAMVEEPVRSPAAEDGARRQLLARRDHDVTGRLGGLTCPVLLCAGRFDAIAPPANSRAIAHEVPHAALVTYEGGHLFFLQDPAAFIDTVAFLEG